MEWAHLHPAGHAACRQAGLKSQEGGISSSHQIMSSPCQNTLLADVSQYPRLRTGEECYFLVLISKTQE